VLAVSVLAAAALKSDLGEHVVLAKHDLHMSAFSCVTCIYWWQDHILYLLVCCTHCQYFCVVPCSTGDSAGMLSHDWQFLVSGKVVEHQIAF